VEVKGAGRAPVEVFAVRKDRWTVVVVANSTASVQKVVVEGLPADGQKAPADNAFELAPYAVHSVVIDTPKP
jgi:hypothetical protein